MHHKFIWLQAIGFQIVWFAWALGVPEGLLWPGWCASTLFLAAHQLWRAEHREDLFLVLTCSMMGLLHDSVLMHWGWLAFPQTNPPPWDVLQPIWMAALWACLGCTLNHSLGWLRGRLSLAMPLSALTGVLSYLAADRMGALDLIQPLPACIVLAVFWGLYIPLLQSLPRQRAAN